jgi:mannitol/fructose-specific phosphotransferase system IIA component (Ntr-type)
MLDTGPLGRYLRPMNLMDYTTAGGFLPRLDCDSVAGAVARLVDRLLDGGDIDSAQDLVGEVMRRETEGSTAIGGGLVIPHARFAGVLEVRIAVATLAEPVDIPSEDGKPVDIVILLVGPDGDPRRMLRVLARLARLVRHESFLQGLREAPTPEALGAAFAKVGESLS